MPSTTEPPAKRRRLLTDPKIELHKWKKSSFRLATIKENSDLRTSPARAQPEFADDFDDVGNYQERSAKLYTTNKLGKQETLVIALDHPIIIGRKPSSHYVIDDPVVSSQHCKIYAINSATGAIILSVQDLSLNGLTWNDHKVRKSNLILMDGDVLGIPHSQSFRFSRTQIPEARYKDKLFDPTPPLHPSKKTVQVGKYSVTSHLLGSGTYGAVYLALDTSSPRQVACKTLKLGGVGASMLSDMLREIKILSDLNHPNVNRIFDHKVVHNQWLHIFLELSTGGDLFTYISDQHRLSEGESKYLGFQLMKGLSYLHERGVSHRDLKPENILLHTPGPFPRLIIADFGLARLKGYKATLSVAGTISYLPPEAIRAMASNKTLAVVGPKIDCWGLGVCLFIMLTGRHPFDCGSADSEDDSDEEWDGESDAIKGRICSEDYRTFSPSTWNSLPEARLLIGRLMDRNPRTRQTASGALESAWIDGEIETLEELYERKIIDC